jgi:hypothetical protein
MGGGYEVLPNDVARLSPLNFKHIIMLGRYAFSLPDIVARGELRPLREPSIALLDEARCSPPSPNLFLCRSSVPLLLRPLFRLICAWQRTLSCAKK